MRHSLFRTIAINAVVFFSGYVLLELFSFAAIALHVVPMPDAPRQLLMAHFPAQLRPLNDDEKASVYGSWGTELNAKLVISLENRVDKELGDERPLNIEAYHNGKILRVEWMQGEPPLFLTQFWQK